MNLKQQIESGLFKEAKLSIITLSPIELEDILIEISYDSVDMSIYLFVQYLIFENNTAELHSLASTLLIISYPSIKGAYFLAYKHMKQATLLAPDNNTFKEGLTFFSIIPEDVID